MSDNEHKKELQSLFDPYRETLTEILLAPKHELLEAFKAYRFLPEANEKTIDDFIRQIIHDIDNNLLSMDKLTFASLAQLVTNIDRLWENTALVQGVKNLQEQIQEMYYEK